MPRSAVGRELTKRKQWFSALKATVRRRQTAATAGGRGDASFAAGPVDPVDGASGSGGVASPKFEAVEGEVALRLRQQQKRVDAAAARELARDMQDLRELQQDVAEVVAEDADKLAVAADHVDEANDLVADGLEMLDEAARIDNRRFVSANTAGWGLGGAGVGLIASGGKLAAVLGVATGAVANGVTRLITYGQERNLDKAMASVRDRRGRRASDDASTPAGGAGGGDDGAAAGR